MKHQDEKIQRQFIERCVKIHVLSGFFKTHGGKLSTLGDEIKIRDCFDHPDWVNECIKVSDTENLDDIVYAPMCGIKVGDTGSIPSEVIFGSVDEMISYTAKSFLEYWKAKMLENANDMAGAIDYTLENCEPTDDTFSEYCEIRYYLNRLLWLSSEDFILEEELKDFGYEELVEKFLQE